jgi:hypothetical protein
LTIIYAQQQAIDQFIHTPKARTDPTIDRPEESPSAVVRELVNTFLVVGWYAIYYCKKVAKRQREPECYFIACGMQRWLQEPL